jgi:ribosomal protein S27AE
MTKTETETTETYPVIDLSAESETEESTTTETVIPPILEKLWPDVRAYGTRIMKPCPSCSDFQYFRKRKNTFRCGKCGTISGYIKN